MGLIIAILLGALVGHIAARIAGRDTGFWLSVVIGVIGAGLGNLVSYAIGGGKVAFLAFDLSGLLCSLGGSILFVYILNAIQNYRTR